MVGYHVKWPCQPCLQSQNNGHYWMFYRAVIIPGSRLNKEGKHDKTNKMSVRPTKTQISLGICPVWSESLVCAYWVVKEPSFLHADSEDSDQTGRMPRLIWVLAGCTAILLVLSCHSSYLNILKPSFPLLYSYGPGLTVYECFTAEFC